MKKNLRFVLDLPLYTKIFIGFVLGAIWGVLFNVPSNKVDIVYLQSNQKIHKVIEWNKLTIVTPTEKLAFNSKQRGKIIDNAQALLTIKNSTIDLIVQDRNNNFVNYQQVISINKVKTWATRIKWIGNIFMRLLSFLAIPLVLASLIVGASSLEDVKKLEKIGIRAFVLYISTTILAITIGLILANTIQPGKRISQSSKQELLAESHTAPTTNLEINLTEYIENIVPKNPFRALAQEEMLQIVFFAVFFGVAMNFVPRDKTAVLFQFFNGMSEVMIQMVDIVMKVAPIGVFALIAATIAEFGFDIVWTLLLYIITVILGLCLQILLVYFPIVKYLGKISPIKFMKDIRVAQLVALSTSSSAATLPITMECVEQNIGVPKKISGFVLPLGATINMDGTALYQGVAAVFIAQVYGMDLSILQQLTIVITAVLASIGTAPVPGVGLLMLVLILNSINVPAEGIALIMGVDRLLDMCRTVPNITGDASVAVAVWGMTEKK